MFIRSTVLLASVFAIGCSSTSSTKDNSYAENSDDSDLVCERYKPIGSNRIQKRCYSKEAADAATRDQQDAEQRRRSLGGAGRVGDG